VQLARLGEREERLIQVDSVTDPLRLVDRAMLAENQAFVDAIRADRAPPISGEEGRRNLAVILTALQSARDERVLRI
jgi:predicted dehydrogenase